ncbi:MAG: phosphatidylinositol mannoside acyltransferase [Sciscionella sp.]
MAGLGERLSDLGYAAGWLGVRALPEPVARALFAYGADMAGRHPGEGVGQLRRNLARVVPKAGEAELDDLLGAALRSYARYWREVFRLPAMDPAAVSREAERHLTGIGNLDAALAAGNGAVIALSHSGNWDVAGMFLVRHSGTFTTVVERLRPESLYRRFVAYRESLGFEVLPLAEAGSGPTRTLLRRLRENRVVCLVADRDLSTTGVDVNFFSERTRMPAGPAHLAAITGAALLPVGCWYTDSGWGFRVHPRIAVHNRAAVSAATQAMADSFAGDIAAHPADWHMMQKLWLADLSPRHRDALDEGDQRSRGERR